MIEKRKFLLRYAVLGILLVVLDAFSKGAAQRSLANYTLKTRRPELYGELVKEQVKY